MFLTTINYNECAVYLDLVVSEKYVGLLSCSCGRMDAVSGIVLTTMDVNYVIDFIKSFQTSWIFLMRLHPVESVECTGNDTNFCFSFDITAKSEQ